MVFRAIRNKCGLVRPNTPSANRCRVGSESYMDPAFSIYDLNVYKPKMLDSDAMSEDSGNDESVVEVAGTDQHDLQRKLTEALQSSVSNTSDDISDGSVIEHSELPELSHNTGDDPHDDISDNVILKNSVIHSRKASDRSLGGLAEDFSKSIQPFPTTSPVPTHPSSTPEFSLVFPTLPVSPLEAAFPVANPVEESLILENAKIETSSCFPRPSNAIDECPPAPPGSPDLEPAETEPFPDYYESCEKEVPEVDRDLEARYNFALSKVFEAVAQERFHQQSRALAYSWLYEFDKDIAAAVYKSEMSSNQATRGQVLEKSGSGSAVPDMTARNREDSVAYGVMTDPPRTPPRLMRTHLPVLDTPIVPPSEEMKLQAGWIQDRQRPVRNVVNPNRLESYDPGENERRAIAEKLLALIRHPEVKPDIGNRFVKMSNLVIQIGDIIHRRTPIAGGVDVRTFMSPTELQLATPMADELFHLCRRLDELLQLEADNVYRIRYLLTEITNDTTQSLTDRFKNVARVVVANLRRPRAKEQQILCMFQELFGACVYNEFMRLRYNQTRLQQHRRIDFDRIEFTGLMMEIWARLNHSDQNYALIQVIHAQLKTEIIMPMTNIVPNSRDIWEEIWERFQVKESIREELDREARIERSITNVQADPTPDRPHQPRYGAGWRGEDAWRYENVRAASHEAAQRHLRAAAGGSIPLGGPEDYHTQSFNQPQPRPQDDTAPATFDPVDSNFINSQPPQRVGLQHQHQHQQQPQPLQDTLPEVESTSQCSTPRAVAAVFGSVDPAQYTQSQPRPRRGTVAQGQTQDPAMTLNVAPNVAAAMAPAMAPTVAPAAAPGYSIADYPFLSGSALNAPAQMPQTTAPYEGMGMSMSMSMHADMHPSMGTATGMGTGMTMSAHPADHFYYPVYNNDNDTLRGGATLHDSTRYDPVHEHEHENLASTNMTPSPRIPGATTHQSRGPSSHAVHIQRPPSQSRFISLMPMPGQSGHNISGYSSTSGSSAGPRRSVSSTPTPSSVQGSHHSRQQSDGDGSSESSHQISDSPLPHSSTPSLYADNNDWGMNQYFNEQFENERGSALR